ncbi:MAG: hypothetical protein OQL19_20415 [Gammaproteobacteria bacterium]|nr:hypothetical protein [Gammaproteobacteria bacterium]
MSFQQESKIHISKKNTATAVAFSSTYLTGAPITTTAKAFVEAKELEFCVKYHLLITALPPKLIDKFYMLLENLNKEHGLYAIDEMLYIWAQSEEILKGENRKEDQLWTLS